MKDWVNTNFGRSIRVARHRYRIGEKVQLLYDATTRFSTAELYEIVRLLPETGGEFQYRIKSTEGSHERIAKESELRTVASAWELAEI
jgi:hypothetical protein